MTSGGRSDGSHRSLQKRLKDRSRRFFSVLPFVRKKRYRRCVAELEAARAALSEQSREFQDELQQLRGALLGLPRSLASQATLSWLKPLPGTAPGGELCLFVTHAASPRIKLHVVDHIRELVAAGIAVVLIVNTDLAADGIVLPPGLLSSLHACVVRQNLGFDFGAWAHCCSLLDLGRAERLYLVNDSIVGPLDVSAFAAMIARVRSQGADLVGLTQNPYPKWHLQSFFLVFNRRLLAAQDFPDLMRHIVNLRTKEAVINTYEIQISEFLVSRGFRCESVFANLEPGSPLPDDTYFRWSGMVRIGFPYIKASILKQVHEQPEARALIPAAYLEAARASH